MFSWLPKPSIRIIRIALTLLPLLAAIGVIFIIFNAENAEALSWAAGFTAIAAFVSLSVTITSQLRADMDGQRASLTVRMRPQSSNGSRLLLTLVNQGPGAAHNLAARTSIRSKIAALIDDDNEEDPDGSDDRSPPCADEDLDSGGERSFEVHLNYHPADAIVAVYISWNEGHGLLRTYRSKCVRLRPPDT